jgi:hypothetical protein
MLLENISDGDVYRITTPLAYFRYNDVPPEWVVASFSERFKNWDDYSFRSFPDTPNEVSPHNVEVDTNTTTLIWENIKSQTGYNIQIATENTFDNIVDNQSFNSNTTVYTTNKLTNNTYYWRIRVKNILDQWGTWSDIFNFDVVAKPYPYDGEILTEITRYIQIIKDNNNNITGVSFNLLWPESEVDFDVYHMQLSTFSDFSNPIYDIQTNHNTFAATNLPNNIYYYWRYRTRINGQWTNWTEYTFKTEL